MLFVADNDKLAGNLSYTSRNPKIMRVVTAQGKKIDIPLCSEDGREYAVLIINGVYYHIERVAKDDLIANYKVDLDPDYEPQGDESGHCFMIAPFSGNR